MKQNLVRVIRPIKYQPSQPRSGDGDDSAWFRLSNAVIKGEPPLCYTESYSGSLNLSETIATSNATGTVALTSGSAAVIGTGTAFISELHLGQFCLVVNAANSRSFLLVVKKINSDTSFTAWEAHTFSGSVSGETLVRLPVIFPVDDIRGTQIRGNTVRFDKGTLLSVGDGVYRQNGSAISVSLTVTRNPKISLYDQTAGTYTNFTLGMATSAAPTLAAVAGGTKQMRAGNYTVVITPERTQTVGWNNPSLQSAAVTIANNDRIAITFPAMDTANGQNAWGVWVTTYAESLGVDQNNLLGPWFRLDQYTGSTAGFSTNIEWTDAEVERNDIVTFNNDAPPQAEFVAVLNNNPVWISCQGIGSASITSPGPFIFTAKPGNVEAAPVDVAFSSSPPEIILGVVSATGRLYLLTTNHLQIAVGTPSEIVPVIIQPYWRSSFANPYQVVFVNDTLYGFTGSGPTRSQAQVVTTDEVIPDTGFAADVQEVIDAWNRGQVLVAHDPINNAICFFHSANALNSSSFWTTRVLMYGLRQANWIGDITLSSTTQDCIVTGAATVSNYLEFLMGGRLANNSVSIGTYRWDQAAGVSVASSACSAFSDMGNELRGHVLKRFRTTAKTTSGTFGIYGFQPTEVIDTALITAGNASSLTGAVALTNTAGVALSPEFTFNAANLSVSAVQIASTYAGSGTLDRIDEVVLEGAEQGIRR